ncbi:PAS domain S-box protein [Pseudomonas songnenensis]|uniref:PAS domain S-box protein n=1 Tax=Pseudomonas songnenensis TaxID=1176259 RepID=A0ABX9V1J3_9PSED|nr:PAS domain S-box protein [Pseudomonas songnenensis]MCQ4300710.1 PAS domain S-box protein [Pseudomonas songnenensis]RMH99612.1 PAS domain S-box protein [Pseudomonas songnenensis]
MIPNAADVAASLHASRRALRVAPWKIVLAYALVAVVWIFATNLIITALGLPESSYTLRIAVFVLFTALGIWWYTRRLADGVMRSQKLVGRAENSYRMLFDRHPAPMWLFDKRTLSIVRGNRQAVAAYGYSTEEFAQLEVLDLYAAHERERLEALAPPATPQQLAGLRQHVARDGRELNVEVLCSALDVDESPFALLMAQDVSAHFQTETQLAGNLRKLELARRVARMGHWQRLPGSEQVDWSPEMADVLGVANVRALSWTAFLDCLHPDDRPAVAAAHEQAERHASLAHEFRVLGAGGEQRWMFERIQLLGGRQRALFGVLMDVTELKAADSNLADEKRRYERMVDGLPDGVLMLRQGRIHYANAAARRLLAGDPLQPLNAQPFLDFVAEHQRAREAARLEALQRGVAGGQPQRLLLVCRDGRPFEAEVTETLLPAGGDAEVQLLIRDVSQAEQLRRDLEEANQRLQHLSQRLIEVQEIERREVARDLHDDVGQHLTGLKLHLQRLIRRQAGDSEFERLSQPLVAGVDAALAKVRSLSLSLHPLQLETLGLEAAVRWHLQHFLEASGTNWALEVRGSTTEIPPGRAVAAFRLVQEAVNNVARHARARTVRILMVCDEHELRLEILDDGCGFDVPDALQGAQSLGLTSMHERVASFGGDLRISSLPGMGTRITALLPAPND